MAKKDQDKRTSLKAAIHEYVKDGCSVSFSGMAGSQCVAHSYEIIRQGIKGLTLMGDSPCEPGDMLVGAGLVDRLEIAYCAYAVAGMGNNFRRAIEDGIPQKVVLEDYSNFTMGMRFLAGAMNIPFMPTKSLLGSDLLKYNEQIKTMVDPYTGQKVALVPAANPDVAIVHVNRADRRGNGQIFGYLANADNMARAAKYTILTCEELVETEEITKYPVLTAIPEYCVDAVVELPYASHPWNMPYSYLYDLPFHTDQLAKFATREGFEQWLEEWCYGVKDHEEYLDKVGRKRLWELSKLERKYMKLPY